MPGELDTQSFVYLTDLLKKPVRVSPSGLSLGRPRDLAARVEEPFPSVTGLVLKVRGRSGLRFAPWEKIREEADFFRLEVGGPEELKGWEQPAGVMAMRADVLDRQIIDTLGVRVVRVNDLHLLRVKGGLCLVHVDVGMSGIFRRLGWTRTVNFLSRALFDYIPKDHLISWKFVQSLAGADSGNHRQVLKLSVKHQQLAQLHPADLAEILEDLDAYKREMIFQALAPEVAAEALEQMDTDMQVDLIEAMPEESASRVVEEMAADEAADLLAELPEEKAESILEEMQEERSEEVRELLTHPEDTAGGLMTTDFVALKSDWTVDETIAILRHEAPEAESIYYLYVLDDRDRLVGVVTLRSLIVANPAVKLSEIMITRLVQVKVDQDKKEVAEVFSKYGFRALPVVDHEGVLKGIVTVDDVIEAVAPDFGK